MFIPRAQRSLKRLASFQQPEASLVAEKIRVADVLEDGLIGIYENNPSVMEENVIFTNNSVYYFNSGEWRKVLYEEISYLNPEPDKDTAKVIKIVTNSGSIEAFSIIGETGRFRDYYTVYQFMNRIVNDLCDSE